MAISARASNRSSMGSLPNAMRRTKRTPYRRRPTSLPRLPRFTFQSFIAFLIALFLFLLGDRTLAPAIPGEGQPITFYSVELQDDLRRLFVSAIDGARESVSLFIYSLNDRSILQALQRAHERGVSLFVVCDEHASAHIDKRLPKGTKLIYAGSRTSLMHLKILIVDQETLLIGSANFTNDSLMRHRNLVAGLTHRELALRLEQLLKDETRWTIPSWKETNPLRFSTGTGKGEFWLLPDERAVGRLRQLMASAQKSLQVALYTFTRWDLAQELIQALERGVQVSVLIDNQSAKGTSAKVAQGLFKKGLTPRLGRADRLLHHKMVIVDGTTIAFGSANWTQAAFKKNVDCLLIVEGLDATQEEKLSKIWQQLTKESLPFRK